MANAMIIFEHPQIGSTRQAPVGFSWTTLFFGFFPALFRGHWTMAIIIFILQAATFGLSSFVFAFIYNKMYVKYLIGEGFKVRSASQDLDFLSQRLGAQIPVLSG